MSSIVVSKDLILLSEEERKQYYMQACEALGLDFRTAPLRYFEQVGHGGKRSLILYALRNASAQLRAKHNLTVKLSEPTITNDAAIFTATVIAPNGGSDSAVGAESIKGLTGKEFGDAIMTAQTKAKRRAILDFAGHGLLDESEVEGMHGRVVECDPGVPANYKPIPSAPAPTPSSAPATEVLESSWPVGESITVVVEGPSIDPAITAASESLAKNSKILPDIAKKYEEAVDQLGPDMAASAGLSEQEITSRLNFYRRDVLQRGGMVPSKGFGIAAKWTKLLSKKAPNKTMEEYAVLLKVLDDIFAREKDEGIVVFIEREIAS